MNTTRTYHYVIACSASKTDQPAPARDLYTSPRFALALRAAQALVDDHHAGGEQAQVLILSGLHGLVRLDTELAPYEQRIDQPGHVTVEQLTASAEAAGITYGDEVYCLLPAVYFDALRAGLDELCVWPQPVYEAAPGIGYQRGVDSDLIRRYTA